MPIIPNKRTVTTTTPHDTTTFILPFDTTNPPPYDTECEDNFTNAYIYYAANASSPEICKVQTGWHVTYHQTVSKTLRDNANIFVFDENPLGSCYWRKESEVYQKAVSKGVIFSQRPLNSSLDVPLMKIGEHALMDHYPHLEIWIILLAVFGFFLCPGFLACCVGCIEEHEEYQRRQREAGK
ncbi:hypothetical protein HDV00_006161 [Rhizophlyctis rosea]|nr:hypothetical protein HDV00_006161 [Rhizophlyctis rosea]